MTADKKAGKFLAWLRITRLQFYPMTWLVYTMGSVAYSATSGKLNLVLYFLGVANFIPYRVMHYSGE